MVKKSIWVWGWKSIEILKDTEKLQIFNNENELKLLWECCQIPDFVKKTYGNHLEVVGKVFNFLRETPGKITSKYMKQQLSILDKLDGNVDSCLLYTSPSPRD